MLNLSDKQKKAKIQSLLKKAKANEMPVFMAWHSRPTCKQAQLIFSLQAKSNYFVVCVFFLVLQRCI